MSVKAKIKLLDIVQVARPHKQKAKEVESTFLTYKSDGLSREAIQEQYRFYTVKPNADTAFIIINKVNVYFQSKESFLVEHSLDVNVFTLKKKVKEQFIPKFIYYCLLLSEEENPIWKEIQIPEIPIYFQQECISKLDLLMYNLEDAACLVGSLNCQLHDFDQYPEERKNEIYNLRKHLQDYWEKGAQKDAKIILSHYSQKN
jgi:hypothetical protein